MRSAIIILSFITLATACTPEERAERREQIVGPAMNSSKWDMPTEAYVGSVKGADVVFEHLNYTTFRLTLNNDVTEGEMNTERGFEDDANATLYILHSDRPAAEQAYFVRYSNGDVVMLDEERKPLKKAKFKHR